MTDFDPDNHDLSGLEPEDASWQAAPLFDPFDYLDDLKDLDLTHEQKLDLLATLWDMLRGFIEMGVDLRSVDPCGQIFKGIDPMCRSGRDDVKCPLATTTEPSATNLEKDSRV